MRSASIPLCRITATLKHRAVLRSSWSLAPPQPQNSFASSASLPPPSHPSAAAAAAAANATTTTNNNDDEASAFLGLPTAVRAAALALAAELDRAAVPYALVGAVGCNAHGHHRATRGVDVLVNREDLRRVRSAIEGRGWLPRYRGALRAFRDTVRPGGVDVDVLVSGDFPGDGLEKPVAFPHVPPLAEASASVFAASTSAAPTIRVCGARVLDLVPLVELKLASGTSAPHRAKDLADVQALIAANKLPREFVRELHVSVKEAFVRLWDQVEEGRRKGLD